jgi:hypothetical protein
MEIEFDFNDSTMIEAGGKYEEVVKIFEKEPFGGKGWMLRSDMTVQSYVGIGIFILHFHENKDVVIEDYKPSTSDIWLNPDVRFLSVWAQENGWNVPKVNRDLSENQMKIWKHFWETNLVDSEFYRQRFQKKQSPFIDINLDDEETEKKDILSTIPLTEEDSIEE